MLGLKPRVAVVIPCYQVENQIEGVLRGLPEWIDLVVAVDDASTDSTPSVLEECQQRMPRLRVLRHDANQGVGGAMKTGFLAALAEGAEIIVKLDGDGQMNPDRLPELVQPLLDGRADMTKGNRLRSFRSIRGMPTVRLLGNVGLTFLTKLATGYWHVFDVQNGFLAARRGALESIPIERLDPGYFFENSLLGWMGASKQVVMDVPMPAVYGDETSHLRPWKVLFSFPPRLAKVFLRRVLLRYLIYDVSPIAVYYLTGTLGIAFGTIFGLYHWYQSWQSGIAASTGTVMVALLPFLLGFNLILQAIHLDILESPRPRPPQSPVPEAETR